MTSEQEIAGGVPDLTVLLNLVLLLFFYKIGECGFRARRPAFEIL